MPPFELPFHLSSTGLPLAFLLFNDYREDKPGLSEYSQDNPVGPGKSDANP